MRQLLPEPVDDIDPVALHAALDRPPPPGRPWLLVNMIESADGATAVDGVSGGLGGAADPLVFRALRALPDVILVAAGTATAESYGPAKVAPEIQEQRIARGQAPRPRIAVVTSRLSVDLSLRLFTEASGPDPADRPLIVTAASADRDRVAAAEEVADVLVVGDDAVDLPAAMAELGRRGARVVLGEGGPTLNGALVADDLLDELCITLSPTLAGGDSHRLLKGAPPALRPLRLERVLEQDGMLFLRYVRG